MISKVTAHSLYLDSRTHRAEGGSMDEMSKDRNKYEKEN